MAKVGVLGAGSWGTALAILLHDNGHDVIVWSIDPKEVEMLSEKREHVSKLPGVHISEELHLQVPVFLYLVLMQRRLMEKH